MLFEQQPHQRRKLHANMNTVVSEDVLITWTPDAHLQV